MPTFFNPLALTPEQTERWEWAMAEYARIQDENLTRTLARMTSVQLAETKQALQLPEAAPESALRESMAAFQGLMGGGAGDPKSALFYRLLSGKPALPAPPPTAFSYPWYAVVEEAGPFTVTLGSSMRTEHGLYLTINQCAWKVVAANEAAAALLTLDEQLRDKPSVEGLAAAVTAYAQNPVFTVQFGEWPAYQLKLGRVETRCVRHHFLESLSARKALSEAFLARFGQARQVLDARNFFLAPTLGLVHLKGEHPRVRIAAQEQRLQAGTTNYPGLLAAIIGQDRVKLDAACAAFEADPDRDDIIGVICDDWQLVKQHQEQ